MNAMINEKCPCRNCPDRVLHCHERCERYKTWKAEVDRNNEIARERKKIDRLSNTHGDYLRKIRKWEYQNRDY